MQFNRSNLAFALFTLLPLAACGSAERRNDMSAASMKEYRACCAMECNASCTKDCCEEYFDDKSMGTYRTCCGKVCDATCTKACCAR